MARVSQAVENSMARTARFIAGGHFALAALALLSAFLVMTSLMLLWPAAHSGLGSLANDFRVWCFGFDPATGRMEWLYVVMMLVDPLVLGAILLAVWWQPVREVLRRLGPRGITLYAAASLGLVPAGIGGLALYQEPTAGNERAFPAADLRIHQPIADFTLTDHRGAPTSLAEHRGKVVILTSVYAHCAHTCPMLLSQVRDALLALSETERAQVRVLGISMDPKRDTPKRLAGLAKRHELDGPNVHLLTGEPATVEALLDRLSVERRRDPQTDVIEHSNLFLLVDRAGQLGYRLALASAESAHWLPAALRVLVQEPEPGR